MPAGEGLWLIIAQRGGMEVIIARREERLAVMIPKPSGIILINVVSGDSKNGNISTRRKSIHLRADFSYRETKILYREKKYLFAGGFDVPGELM